jgi:hypothetical protein
MKLFLALSTSIALAAGGSAFAQTQAPAAPQKTQAKKPAAGSAQAKAAAAKTDAAAAKSVAVPAANRGAPAPIKDPSDCHHFKASDA